MIFYCIPTPNRGLIALINGLTINKKYLSFQIMKIITALLIFISAKYLMALHDT